MPSLTPQNAAARRTRVGASEVAALMPSGHPYLTVGDLYARIVHGVTRHTSPAMQMGHDLEAVTLRLAAAQLGVRVRRNRRTFLHRTLPLACTPDAIVPGTGDLVEVKVVSRWALDDWDDGPPAHVRWQAQAQALVCRRERVHVAALLAGGSVKAWTLPADPEAWRAILVAVAAFQRDHLTPRIPPPDAMADPELVLTVTAPEGTVIADGDLLGYGEALAALAAATGRAKEREDEARGALILGMAAAGAAQVIGPGWVAQTATSGTGVVGLRFTRGRQSRERTAA